MLGLAAVLEQQGRRVAQVPLWSVISTAALPIAEFGSTEQKASWLPGLLDGSVIVTGASTPATTPRRQFAPSRLLTAGFCRATSTPYRPPSSLPHWWFR